LANRSVGREYHVVRFTRHDGRKTFHVVCGGIAEVDALQRRLQSIECQVVTGFCAEVTIVSKDN
jgi:hypothetical protein